MKDLLIHFWKMQISVLMRIDILELDDFINNTLKKAKIKLDKGLVKRSDYSIELLNAIECLRFIEEF